MFSPISSILSLFQTLPWYWISFTLGLNHEKITSVSSNLFTVTYVSIFSVIGQVFNSNKESVSMCCADNGHMNRLGNEIKYLTKIDWYRAIIFSSGQFLNNFLQSFAYCLHFLCQKFYLYLQGNHTIQFIDVNFSTYL